MNLDFQKVLNNYLKEKRKNSPDVIVTIRDALKRSGHEKLEPLIENGKFVLLDLERDVTPGIILDGNTIKDFKNTDDFETVTVGAYARYNVLKRISIGEDVQAVKEIFKKKRTWVIHCVSSETGFEAHTHGLDAYSHPDFRIKKDVGKEEIAYLLNSLSKSIQRGNAFRDGDRIENLYENCDVVLKKADDGIFDVSFVTTRL